MTRVFLVPVLAVIVAVAATGAALAQQPQEVEPQVQQPAPPPLLPDDIRLQQIVKLVQAGLSESLIAESVQREVVPYNLTPRDLLYLKENKVPESLIAALLAVQAPAAPSPGRQVAQPEPEPQPEIKPAEPEPPKEVVVDGLILRTGSLRRNRPGSITFLEATVEWRDAADSTNNMTIYPAGVKEIQMRCRAAAEGPFCYELRIDVNRGDTIRFEDAEQAMGGNKAILALRDAWHEKYPSIRIVERTRGN